ncbi:MAG: hypothetical protein ABW199_01115 [Caulobacterales bacterium]
MIRAALAAAALTAVLAIPAMAAPRTYEARLVTPVSAPTSFVADGAVWNCAASSCVASRTGGGVTMSGCRRVVREVGAVTFFGSSAAPFAEDRLATCNGSAAPAQAAAAAPEAAAPAAQ